MNPKGSRKTTYSTRQAAEMIGVSKNTLLNWFKNGKIPEVSRDYNGWRIFTDEDIDRIRSYRDRITLGPAQAERPLFGEG
jgi:excisionase family DNA binding protein